MKLAQDEGSPVRGFGVVEYESAEQAEAVLIEMDRTLVGGQEVRLSLCTPGTSGRSTLAALIAAQGMVSSRPCQGNPAAAGQHAVLPGRRCWEAGGVGVGGRGVISHFVGVNTL